MKKVYVGVGHGAKDYGAVREHLKESELALDVANACTNYLKKNNIDVKQSRVSQYDGTIPINNKAKEANAWKADLCIDIHFNASGGDGAECFYKRIGGVSKKLADNILKEFIKVGQNSRGAKTKTNQDGTDYFGMVRLPAMPAVIVECAFIDTVDIHIADSTKERKALGEAIAKGILTTLVIPIDDPTRKIKTGDMVIIAEGSRYGGMSSANGITIPNSQLAPKMHKVGRIESHNKIEEAYLIGINSWVALSSLKLI